IRDTFNDFMNSPGMVFLRETLPEAFRVVREVITNALSSDGVGAVFEGLVTYFERVQEYGQILWDFFVSMAPGVTKVFEDLWIILQPIFQALGTAFSVIGDIVMTVAENILLPILKLVWGAFQTLWSIVNPILQLLGIAI